jgi:DNA repair exonuclease SbcCD nuclease subunit
MKFIHLTDLHLVPPGRKLWGFDTFPRLDQCFADIVKYHGDAEFCAVSGDLTERGDVEAYTALKERLKKFPIPVYLMMGNHDEKIAVEVMFMLALKESHSHMSVLQSLMDVIQNESLLTQIKEAATPGELYDLVSAHIA